MSYSFFISQYIKFSINNGESEKCSAVQKHQVINVVVFQWTTSNAWNVEYDAMQPTTHTVQETLVILAAPARFLWLRVIFVCVGYCHSCCIHDEFGTFPPISIDAKSGGICCKLLFAP
jgi:hypothetical protein